MGGGPVRLLVRLQGPMGEGEERNVRGKRGETERGTRMGEHECDGGVCQGVCNKIVQLSSWSQQGETMRRGYSREGINSNKSANTLITLQ